MVQVYNLFLYICITPVIHQVLQTKITLYTIIIFCWGQYKFLWTLKTILAEAFRLRWILISKVHKNSYWPIQKTFNWNNNILCYYIMILIKKIYWLSCCHLTLRKIWYCLIKTRIDLFHFRFLTKSIKRITWILFLYLTLPKHEICLAISVTTSQCLVFLYFAIWGV
jgi:hypothetical protein